ncbi:hypothetical protein PRK78_004381 [Emydomyces testavorans]|uniref:Non-homologous end-joining factor 1 n=1 Tax=Emydomyces testavorans TaxID=2070801 RepID=A0AAF0DIQ1_9EURO|nr:hypothetical protein PRK78_004381 [Emydomyces testavorans]
MQQNWKKLPLESHGLCPPLYLSYSAGPNGYEVFLTDLARVWSESLNRKQVLANASKYDTSIDPSEDDDQYNVLLQKIGDALSGKQGTSLSLRGHQNGDSLRLSTKTKLPSPLEPLTWTMNLTQLPQTEFTKQVFLPVLRGAASCEARTKSLIEKLKEKDWALGKLFDKMASSGIDLSTVFPSLTGLRHGRRGSTFSQASKLVKGVAPFDENSWNLEVAEQTHNDHVDESIIKEFRTANSSLELEVLENVGDDWWTQIRDPDHAVTNVATSRKAAVKKEAVKPVEEDLTEDEDEFETRETPPRFRKPLRTDNPTGRDAKIRASPAKEKRCESTASSEDEHGSPAQQLSPRRQGKKPQRLGMTGSKISKRERPSVEQSADPDSPIPSEKRKANVKGLGTIGGRKPKVPKVDEPSTEKSDNSTESDVSMHEPTKKTSTYDQSTETESEEAPALRPNKRLRPPPPADGKRDESLPHQKERPTKSSGGGLGQIGGKKRKETPKKNKSKQSSPESVRDDEVRRDQHIESHASTPKPAKRQNKLGTIGGPKSRRSQAAIRKQNDKPLTPSPQEMSISDEASDNEKGRQQVKSSQAETSKRTESPRSKIKASPPVAQEGELQAVKQETPEERANRKRDELRRQLESKSGPAKKKRRF